MYQPWKVLIYIAADNVLYPNSQVSLREITDASSLGGTEMIVQLDGPTAAMATRYRCEKGSKRIIWEAPQNYTADRAERLRDFLEAAAGNSTAHQRLMLILWGEGSGLDHIYFYGETGVDGARTTQPGQKLTTSLGSAEHLRKAMRAIRSAPNDVLDGENANLYVKNIQLGRILREFTRKLGRRIDILGFDACLMAMAEICYEVRDSVSVVVGSDEEIPMQSWPYSLLLKDLERFPGMDANTLATLIVSRYVEKYGSGSMKQKASLSAMRLSGSEEMGAAMKRLTSALQQVSHDVASKRRIFRARDASRDADETSYIDFGVFCEELMQSFEEHSPIHACARDLLFILKNHSYILYHRDTGEDGSYDAYGLSICFPQALPPDEAGLAAAEAEFSVATHAALAGHKDPPHHEKDPPHHEKDPPHHEKDPPHHEKDPPHHEKDPGSRRKDPPHHEKFPPSGSGGKSSPMEITSYYILWDSYVPLDFNRDTGWAKFLESVLDDQSNAKGAGM